jgi:alpha-galactosidase
MKSMKKTALGVPERALLLQDGNWVEFSKDESGFGFKDIRLSFEDSGLELKVKVTAGKSPVSRIKLLWPADFAPGTLFLGDHWERGYGDLEWNSNDPARIMPWHFVALHNGALRGYGVKTGPSALCFWRLAEQLELVLDIRCGGTGVLLGGRVLETATLIAASGDPSQSAYAQARSFARLLCDSPVMPKNPVYGGNNWYYAYGISSAEQIKGDADFISKMSDSSNRPFMVIDDGWQELRTGEYIGGPWRSGNAKFGDMSVLSKNISDLGTIPGIWLRPLLTSDKRCDSLKLKRTHRPAAGVELFGSLDPSIPEVLDLVREDMSVLSGWGYKLIKFDFTTYDILGRWGFEMGESVTDSGWSFNDRGKTTMEVITDLYKALRAGAPDAVICACNTIGHASAGLFEMQRTGDDTSGVDWSRTRKMGVNTLAFRGVQHGTFFSADADCVGITDKIPWELNERWLELLAESGTPLFVSADPATLGERQKTALKKAFSLASQELPLLEPLDWLETSCPREYILNGARRSFDWGE